MNSAFLESGATKYSTIEQKRVCYCEYGGFVISVNLFHFFNRNVCCGFLFRPDTYGQAA